MLQLVQSLLSGPALAEQARDEAVSGSRRRSQQVVQHFAYQVQIGGGGEAPAQKGNNVSLSTCLMECTQHESSLHKCGTSLATADHLLRQPRAVHTHAE